MSGTRFQALSQRARAQGRPERLLPWLAPAAVAHAGLILAVALFGRQPPLLKHDETAEARSAPNLREAAVSPIELVEERAAGEAGDGSAADPGGTPPHRTASRMAAKGTASSFRADGGSSGSTHVTSPAAGEAATAEGAETRPERSGPRLSLRELGVGGPNPFLGGPNDLPTARQRYTQRLRQSLRADLARGDQRRGLGPEGPAIAALPAIVLASAAAPNTSALLRVSTNGAGEITLVEVLESDRDGVEWGRIADRLREALARKRLRVPQHSGGVSFQLRVVSKVQLPSGADPGLAIDVFGIPLKKGDGDRSSKISVLSPALREVAVPGHDRATVRVPTLVLFGVAGDPADIGSVARRLVSAYLVAMDTIAPPDAPSTEPREPDVAPAPATP